MPDRFNKIESEAGTPFLYSTAQVTQSEQGPMGWPRLDQLFLSPTTGFKQ